MIPEEVAEIASMLRDAYETDHLSVEEEFDYSVELAWKIYNKFNRHREADFESRPMFHD